MKTQIFLFALLAAFASALEPYRLDSGNSTSNGTDPDDDDGCNGIYNKFAHSSFSAQGIANQAYEDFPIPGSN